MGMRQEATVIPPLGLRRWGQRLLVLRPLLYWGLVAVMGLVVVALAISLVPRALGYGSLVVYGGSMGDALPNGSLAIAAHVPAREVRPGDIIVARNRSSASEAPKVHRVLWVAEQQGKRVIQTKGDANAHEDPVPIIAAPSEETMKVVMRVPFLGYIVDTVRTPLGWSLMVMVPSVLVCVFTVWRLWRPAKPKAAAAGVQVEFRRWKE